MVRFVQEQIMTYCVGIKLNAGLVFLSDSRTNAGVDHISTFRKMIVYEQPGDRVMVLLSAGNLSISQSVREILQIEELRETHDDGDGSPPTVSSPAAYRRTMPGCSSCPSSATSRRKRCSAAVETPRTTFSATSRSGLVSRAR